MAAAIPIGLVLVVLAVGTAMSLRRSPFPLICSVSAALMMGGYGLLVLGTLRQDRAIDAVVQRSALNPARLQAELTGQPWPGPTDWSVVGSL